MNYRYAYASLALLAISTIATARTPLPPEVVTDKNKVGPGTHVIQVEREEDCTVNELNLAKHLTYDMMGTGSDVTVRVSIAGTVGSNLARSAVCRTGKSEGKILVEGPATVEVMGTPVYAPVKVAKVEKVTGTKPTEKMTTDSLGLEPGRYLIQVEALGSCYPAHFNVKRSRHFDRFGFEATQILERGQTITDNLMRPGWNPPL